MAPGALSIGPFRNNYAHFCLGPAGTASHEPETRLRCRLECRSMAGTSPRTAPAPSENGDPRAYRQERGAQKGAPLQPITQMQTVN